MDAKKYLQQVSKLDRMINNKMIEKEQWKAIALGTTTLYGGESVQSSSDQQKMANAVCRYVAIEEEIDECIDSLVDIKKEVISTIEQLPEVEYDLLHKAYIQGIDFYTIADDYKKTYTWVTTVHGRALKHVQDILDKKE